MPEHDPSVDPLTTKTGLSASERKLRGAHAAAVRWSGESSREHARVKARESMARRFEQQVDPEGRLPVEERAKLAESARRAHLLNMSFKAARARRLRKEQAAAAEDVGGAGRRGRRAGAV